MLAVAIISGITVVFLMIGFVLYCCLRVYDNSERQIEDYWTKKRNQM